MATTIAITIAAAAFGCVLGMVLITRHHEIEQERAYLTGHVDGYRKAEDDLDYHREADRHYGENND